MAVGEFGCHRLSKQDRARRTRQRNRACVKRRATASINRRPVAARHVGRVEDVLDAERHAFEQAALAIAIASAGRCERLFRVEMYPGAHLWVALMDAVKATAHDCLSGQFATRDQAGQRRRRQSMRFGNQHVLRLFNMNCV